MAHQGRRVERADDGSCGGLVDLPGHGSGPAGWNSRSLPAPSQVHQCRSVMVRSPRECFFDRHRPKRKRRPERPASSELPDRSRVASARRILVGSGSVLALSQRAMRPISAAASSSVAYGPASLPKPGRTARPLAGLVLAGDHEPFGSMGERDGGRRDHGGEVRVLTIISVVPPGLERAARGDNWVAPTESGSTRPARRQAASVGLTRCRAPCRTAPSSPGVSATSRSSAGSKDAVALVPGSPGSRTGWSGPTVPGPGT
jgi:hypothetical protein